MKTNHKPELLSPAGSPEALLAALRCGADAVYLGGASFNARSTAQNFSRSAIADAGKACKARGAKLCFTLNTMLTDQELPEALDLANDAVQAGAGAIIVQDIGLMSLLRGHIALHASTQCSVQTAQGMALLKKLGTVRAVLPRECTKEELARLAAEAP